MKKILNRAILYGPLLFFPVVGLAQTIGGTIVTLETVINLLIGLLFLVATLVFLWGIVMYLTAAGDESKIETGREYIIWGIIALFIMVAVWGIVQILVNTFGIGQTGIPTQPL